MRRNRRDSIRKERIIMVASSAFVLAALTMTGLYMKGQEAKQRDDGYTLDFSALENNTDNKLQDIGMEQAKNTDPGKSNVGQQNDNPVENDLDYMPAEDLSAQVGSNLIEIPGLTDQVVEEAPEVENEIMEPKAEEPETKEETSKKELHYSEEKGLTRPVNGDVLMPYSMDGSIYFATLDQYKYNPATLFSAEEGNEVFACAEGRVIKVFEDAELGQGITLELGDGYTVTYGQMKDIQVEQDSYVKAGEKLGVVSSPSRYYVQDGTNLYFRMEKDGSPINSEALFQ